jgi:enoyl-CoA hydratase
MGEAKMYNYFLKEMHGNVLVVKVNRPNNMNALNTEVIKELDVLIDEIVDDDNVYVIVITGEGKAFIAGADIAEMAKLNESEAIEFSSFGQKVFLKLENMGKPTIAAINGYCLGGGNELALSCDIRLASEKAKFGQPEVTLGITPGFAGTQRLTKAIPIAVAKEMIYTGGIYNATFAEKVGLVSHVYAKEDLMEEALKLAQAISKNGQLSVRASKMAINKGLEEPLEKGNDIEARYFSAMFSTVDQKNAMKAFLNKEKYTFENR